MIEDRTNAAIVINLPAFPDFKSKIDLTTQSQPYFRDCQIQAEHDLEAVTCWLKKYAHNLNTFGFYKRQAKLFLMWCCYESGKSINQLKVQDFEAYFDFLKHPPQTWCTDRAQLRRGKIDQGWRPLVGGLSQSSLKMSFKVLQSLMNYLASSQYIRSNPMQLMKLESYEARSIDDQKYQVWSRMLEADEWVVLQKTLIELPEANMNQIGFKIRAQFLFALLYFLGLRLHEVETHTWSAFQYKDEQWWFFVKGKGGKLGHVPVHDQLLKFVKLYRIYLGKMPLPESSDQDFLIVSQRKKPLQSRQIYNIVKKVGALAALQFKDDPQKVEKLKKLSPHWLRHLSASHQDKAGIQMTMIKENLRHCSNQTTQIYLHAEDRLRHQEMQKLSLEVEPESISVELPVKQTRLDIELTQGPIHKDLGFEKLIEAIEANVLKGYKYKRYHFDKQRKINWIQSSIVPIQKIEFSYILNQLDEESTQALKNFIALEANIRLFSPIIKFSYVLAQH